jgi:hypothetical protein
MRRGMSIVEMAVAIAVAVTLYIALETLLAQQRKLVAFAQHRMAIREAAVAVARELIADPDAVERLEREGSGALAVQVALAPLEGQGARLARVTVTGPRGSDTVQVVLRE